ncbi:cell division protein [Bacteroidales bacterium]|nr:cell division protein [Bacteroidales bacterium]
MKLKIVLCGIALSLLFSLNSCKSKESAYKAAYEKAKEKEIQDDKYKEVEEITAVSKPKAETPSNASFQKEKVTAIDENGSHLKKFSVVVGSFTNKTNATSLCERMKDDGYKALVAQNEKGMYRVIVASFDDKASAAQSRNDIKIEYSPDFKDAWLLEQY